MKLNPILLNSQNMIAKKTSIHSPKLTWNLDFFHKHVVHINTQILVLGWLSSDTCTTSYGRFMVLNMLWDTNEQTSKDDPRDSEIINFRRQIMVEDEKLWILDFEWASMHMGFFS